MFLTVPWGILILSKIARGMFCIIKSNYTTSCNSFLINREKLGDYLKWTDFSRSDAIRISRRGRLIMLQRRSTRWVQKYRKCVRNEEDFVTSF